MNGRNSFQSILMACSLAVGLGGLVAMAGAASAGPSFVKPGESAGNNVIEIKQRGRGPLFYLPIAPSYLAYDYPYYYSRGHYPTHIRPGYVFYGYSLSTTTRAPIGAGYASPVGRTKGKLLRSVQSQSRR